MRARAATRNSDNVDRLRYSRLSRLFEPMEESSRGVLETAGLPRATRSRRSLPPETIRDLEAEVEWLTVKSGQPLFHQDDPADSAYVVVSGRLRIAVETPEGGEQVINEVNAGETVGEAALLTGGRRSAAAYAVRDTDLAKISRRSFTRLIAKYPQAMVRISRLMSRRLQDQTSHGQRQLAASSSIALVPADPSVPLTCRRLRPPRPLPHRHGGGRRPRRDSKFLDASEVISPISPTLFLLLHSGMMKKVE